MNVFAGKRHALDSRQHAILTVQPPHDTANRMHTRNRMQRSAVMIIRQFA